MILQVVLQNVEQLIDPHFSEFEWSGVRTPWLKLYARQIC